MAWRPPSPRLWHRSRPWSSPFAALAYDLLAIWAVAMVPLAGLRRRWRLALALLTAIPIAAAVTLVLNAALGLEGDARDLALGAPQDGVPIQLVLGLGLASIAARELSRPFRTTTHRLAVAAGLGAFLLPVSTPVPSPVRCAGRRRDCRARTGRLRNPPDDACPRATSGSACCDLGVETEPVDQWPDGVHEAIASRRLTSRRVHHGQRRAGHTAHGHAVAVPLVSEQRKQPASLLAPAARAPGLAPAPGSGA